MDVWVPGIPATFATRGERPWKKLLGTALPLPPPSASMRGLVLDFRLMGKETGYHAADVDNLCEPVFAVLVGQKKWFSGRRPNIEWYRATKAYVGSDTGEAGCRISMRQSPPSDAATSGASNLFAATYEGPLPHSATDEPFAAWVRAQAGQPRAASRQSITLRFGGSAVNIGEIATGRVKSTIDCLYPLIGGRAGAPEDWRIMSLDVQKNAPNILTDAVQVIAESFGS